MIGHGEKLNRKQEAAIGALLTCSSLPEAAIAVGVSQSSLRRWLKNERLPVAIEKNGCGC